MSLFDLEHDDAFASRHIGVVDPADTQQMLDAIGFSSLRSCSTRRCRRASATGAH